MIKPIVEKILSIMFPVRMSECFDDYEVVDDVPGGDICNVALIQCLKKEEVYAGVSGELGN